jgi:GntR family transcriptional repressor for pyruvate dehydrogenase complex
VREALRILETEGFITVRRGNRGGAVVHSPDIATAGYALGITLQAMQVPVADVGAALATLEPLCASLCAARPDRRRNVVPLLRASLEASRAVIDDGPAFTRSSREFHDLMVTLVPNATLRVLTKSVTSLWSVQEVAWADAQTSRGAYPSRASRETAQQAHERLVEAIASGDAGEAARIAGEHVTATQRLVTRTLRDRVVDAASPRSRPHFRRGAHG